VNPQTRTSEGKTRASLTSVFHLPNFSMDQCRTIRSMDDHASGKWKAIFDQHQAALAADLSVTLARELEASAAQLKAQHEESLTAQLDAARQQSSNEGREAGRRATAEALNQALRRLRQSPSQAAVLQLLVESTVTWAPAAAVFALEDEGARSLALRGLLHEDELQFPLAAAGAFRTVVDTKDPVTAVATEAELSATLANALATGDETTPKAYLFPVSARQNVVAVLLASGKVAPAPLELLCEAAGMKLELLVPPAIVPLKNPELVQIAAAAITAPAAQTPQTVPQKWSDLSADDQKLHLQAQRVARVKVAELRLYQAEELRKGVFSGNIYGSLQTQIDAARSEFLQTFLSKSPTMVDYLHLEMLRSLAHEDDRLLGPDYPGPMV
jgi:hypothetical protein